MFAENQKVSYRQLKRLYVFNLLGVGTLIIPTEIALLGKYGFAAITIGFIMAEIFLAAVVKIRNKYINRKIFNVVVFAYQIAQASFLGWVFVDLIRYSLIPDEAYITVLLVILAISAYALSGGMESRARTYEVVFWFIIVPLLLMFAFAFKDMHVKFFFIKDTLDIKQIIYGAYIVFISFSSIFNVYFLREYDNKKIVCTVSKSLVITYFIMILLYMLLIGSFGKYALASMKFPAVTLMSNVQIKGSFFKRTDALMLAIWFFTLFAILNMSLFYAMGAVERLIKKKSKKLSIAITICTAFIMAVVMEYGDGILKNYTHFLLKIGIPVMIFFVAITLLAGCSAVELEERCFPMLAGIDQNDNGFEFYYSIDNATEPVYAQSVQNVVKKCENNLSKTADTNHLKVLLIGNSLYDNKEKYNELVEYLIQSRKFPRNTYVCAVDDINNTFENMGDYYEQLLEKQEREDGLCLVTVGNIMDDYENGLSGH